MAFARQRSPMRSVMLSDANEISGFLTVIWQVLLTPSTVTVIVAVPCLTAVTFPVSLTVATLLLLLFHLGLLLEVDVTERESVSLRNREAELLFNLTEGFLTVTLQVAVDLSAATVIVALPGFFARIVPFSSTEATLLLLDLKVTGCPLDVSALKMARPPFSREMFLALSQIEVF